MSDIGTRILKIKTTLNSKTKDMKSKITGGPAEKLFSAKVLGKYDIDYYRCVETGFIQTSEVFWLEEAYSEAITSLDLGLLERNKNLVPLIAWLIQNNFDPNGRFIDYAGGYGVLTRMMRDSGYDFYHSDPYCENLFAKLFDVTESKLSERYELLTAFEVFEHYDNPIDEIRRLTSYSDSILFTTELVPKNQEIRSIDDWSYFIPETGQHIAFYTESSLLHIGKILNLKLYTNGSNIHLLTRKTFYVDPLKKYSKFGGISDYWKAGIALLNYSNFKQILWCGSRNLKRYKPSLLQQDYALAKSSIPKVTK